MMMPIDLVARHLRLCAGITLLCLTGACTTHTPDPDFLTRQSGTIERQPVLSPDYRDVTIPPNIAPLNFRLREQGSRFALLVRPDNGKAFILPVVKNEVLFPLRLWQRLLSQNSGAGLNLEIFVAKDRDTWQRYRTFKVTIAADSIDPYIAYRKLKVNYSWYTAMGLYQREVGSFRESEILHNRSISKGCTNCHTFNQRNPDSMFIHIRSARLGSSAFLNTGDTAVKIGTKFGYTSWHPSGKFATYSINGVHQVFHAAGQEPRDVFDLNSGLLHYDLEKHFVYSVAALAQPEVLETYPEWAPDGCTLYYCAAPILWQDRKEKVPPENLDKLKYSLMKIGFDPATGLWGQPDTVLSAGQAGKSLTFPKVSPDGRFLLFCLGEYGPSPHMQPGADLGLLEIASGRYAVLSRNVNSPFAESWHSWSSNSRWIIFSSKRNGGLFTRLYISHVDSLGNVSKAFVLPQKDPLFYDSYLKTFSLPEFIRGPVTTPQWKIARALQSRAAINVKAPLSGASPKPAVRRDGGNEVPERE
jgi:hypothetical protein